MKKSNRIIALLCTIVLVFGMMVVPVSAAAQSNNSQGVVYVQLSLTERLAQSIAEAANQAIAALVEQALKDPNANAYLLYIRTEAIAKAAIVLISLLGFDAQCERVEYIIGGVSVWIDPIIVIPRDDEDIVVKPPKP